MAGLGCVRDGSVDIAAAVVVAERMGCAPEAAAPLVMSVSAGLWAGLAKRREQEGG